MNQSLQALVFTALFAALAAALGFALFEIPNVELVTLVVFLAGALLGVRRGMLVGIIGEGLFSGLHPLGSGLAIPPLFAAQVAVYGLVGVTGGLFRGHLSRVPAPLLGLVGLLLSLLYDLGTSAVTIFVFGAGEKGILAYFLLGIHFYLVHMGSNFLIFAVLVRRLVAALADYLPENKW